MKRLVCSLVSVLWFASACGSSDGSPPAPNASDIPDAGDQGTTPSSEDAGGALGVECTHPGAGEPIGNDRCACATTRNIGGEWSSMRTCREGDLCPTKDKAETLMFMQDGTSVRIDRGDAYSATGTLCGDVLVFSGGPKDGLNPECGAIRFTDDAHFLTDSCYAWSGECKRTYSEGCPEQKGQCTGTGAKLPETAAAIQKVVCTNQ
jgi:hypothetical protein